jgi:polyphosphate kinase
VAPLWLRNTFISLINREIGHAKDGKEAAIIAKMNSLCDKEIIEKLYEASNAGVKIHLIVRGICCLRAGIPGVSENIQVTSIVGTYLEHARIFYFYNSGAEDIYMGSADWMPRNLDRRVEIIFPVEDEILKSKVKHILDVQLADNLKAYEMTVEGKYVKVKPQRGKKPIGAQDTFCKEAKRNNEPEIDFLKKRTFTPRLANEVFDE